MAVVPFGLQQEGEPVPQGQLVQLVCLIEGFPALCHSGKLEFVKCSGCLCCHVCFFCLWIFR